MIQPNINISDYRYERKFFITSITKYEIESIVKIHPAIFSEIFYQRYVNNIYFDYHNLNNYYDNTEGLTNRRKIRIRWYGHLFGLVEKPILEIKEKNGLLGKKISIPIKSFKLSNAINMRDVFSANKELSDISSIDYRLLKPVLLNRYSRQYYSSCDKIFRITIDSKQSFYQINTNIKSFSNKIEDNKAVILELKYKQEYDSLATNITTLFPFRITKSSKYIHGMQQVYPMLY